MRTMLAWLRQPCSYFQITCCAVMCLASAAFLEYKSVDRYFNLLYIGVCVSMCLGMLATNRKWKVVEIFCLLGLVVTGGWLGTWLYLHLTS